MKNCLPLPQSDDRALMVAAKRVRALVLEEMGPFAGVLFVVRRPSPAAVPVDLDDPRRCPVGTSFRCVTTVGLVVTSSRPCPTPLPTGRIIVSRCATLNRSNFHLIDAFLTSPLTCFSFGRGGGGGVLETREPAVTLGGSGGEDPQALFMGSVTAESRPTLLLTARSCGAPQGFHSDKASGGKTSERLEASL